MSERVWVLYSMDGGVRFVLCVILTGKGKEGVKGVFGGLLSEGFLGGSFLLQILLYFRNSHAKSSGQTLIKKKTLIGS